MTELEKPVVDSQKMLYPFVSICTPTFNRRPFIPSIIKCIESQDYPKDKIEWIIIDDGTDKIEDLVAHIPYVKYSKYDKKMSLGEKRNLMHDKAYGAIIVYMDDDDYYPPCRVSHAVTVLQQNPSALCAGSSEMYLYFKHIHKMYKFGPYGPNHATAATFAFRRELLLETRYEDDAAIAEERHFLKDYTVPFVQLDSMKTILVFSHIHNTFDKKILLNQAANNPYIKESVVTVDDFVKNPDIKRFFMETIDELLSLYNPGNPEHKPDVLKQIADITHKRELTYHLQVIELMKKKMSDQSEMIDKLLKENKLLCEHMDYYEKKITEMISARIKDLKIAPLK